MLSFLNFHPGEVVACYCDPQIQVGENYSYFFTKTFANLDNYLIIYFNPNNC